MNILSLFDGMSCGQIALNRLGIRYDKYFASEIDKSAIKVAMSNYPETIQIGDVTSIQSSSLPKIDLLIGGSPCQGFSFSGKQANFSDPRSKLFFEYVRLLKDCNPKYFLLENVDMKKEYQNVISGELGVEPIKINSSLVSAQKRNRLYWTNIPQISQPEDKGILLKDIIERGFVDKEKAYCLLAGNGGASLKQYFEKNRNQLVFSDNYLKYGDLSGKNKWLLVKEVKEVVDRGDINIRRLSPVECERLQTVPDGYTSTVSNTQRYKMLGNGWTIDVIAHILKHLESAGVNGEH